jgi:hypothetical protein
MYWGPVLSRHLPLTPTLCCAAARMQRHRSMTEEPVLAFGGHVGPEGNPQDLHKSASDPSHIVHGLQGMGSLTWVSPSSCCFRWCHVVRHSMLRQSACCTSCAASLPPTDGLSHVVLLQSDLAALGHSGVPPAMQTAIERCQHPPHAAAHPTHVVPN